MRPTGSDMKMAVRNLYPDVDLSSITVPMVEVEPTDEMAVLIEKVVPASIEVEAAIVEGQEIGVTTVIGAAAEETERQQSA